MSWNSIVNEVGKRYSAALSVLRGPADPEGYPREANASRFLANALGAQRSPGDALVECEYWWRYTRRTSRDRCRSIADVWTPGGDGPEVFAEVKLAGFRSRTPMNIGWKPAPGILELWADDIWYLLALANRHPGTPVEKAFVVVVFGDCAIDLSGTAMRTVSPGDADLVHEQLMKVTHGNNVQAVQQFFDRLADRTGAEVFVSEATTPTVKHSDDLQVRCIAAVWRDQTPWNSTRYTFETWTDEGRWVVRRT